MTNPPRFQFSLGSLLAVVTLCAVIMAAVKTLGLELVLGFSGLASSCGFVLLLALALVPFDSAISRLHDWKLFVFTAILFYGLDFAFGLFDAAVNQPHPEYIDGGQITNAWVLRAVAGSAAAAPLPAIFLLIPVAFNFESPRGRRWGHAYYPQLANVRRGLRLLHVRLILMIGGLLVVGYYAATVIEVSSKRCGIVCPPERVWISCHLLWGVLWLADCASRPNRDIVKVAIGYLCITALFLLLFGFGTMGV
jgi:hypothetical protein